MLVCLTRRHTINHSYHTQWELNLHIGGIECCVVYDPSKVFYDTPNFLLRIPKETLKCFQRKEELYSS